MYISSQGQYKQIKKSIVFFIIGMVLTLLSTNAIAGPEQS